ncbi:MAG: recombination-associated protein RdgC [Gammaproteobacteria bacterium]|nr:recombination-associated protein RdgC [Gammaproteobacteria bacterium]
MWFRNLRAWRLTAPFDLGADELSTRLAQDAFTPCAPGQAETLGWEAPLGGEDPDALVHAVAGKLLLRARTQERILPGSAVNEILPERLAAAEEKEGRRLRAAERRELAEGIRAELLPKALLRSVRQWLLIDPGSGLVMIDTATAARGEALLTLLRGSLGNLGVRPLSFTQPLDGVLTAWVRSRELPQGFELGGWCDLEHPQDTANKVRFRAQPLDEDDVVAALDRGLRVTALELLWEAGADEPLSCVLSEDGAFRRLKLPTGEAAASDDESAAARLDADLALLGLTLNQFFAALFPALGGVAED